MTSSGRALVPQAALVLALAGTFAAAELLRDTDAYRATVLSMAGWTGFVVLFLWWLWQECGLRAGLRELARVGALAAVAVAVLYAYYRRSGLLAAGIEVDAGYTFLGVQWFVALHNPITYAGRTTSFHQFPLAMLTHLPGVLVGFDRLGPFAIHVGIMLQLGVLLALLTTWLVERRIVVQLGIAALAAAVFSNRLTVLLYNLTGYAIPAVTVGAIFFVIALGDRTPSVLIRRVGGLLVLAVLHHYPGVFFVVPLVAAWVVAGRAPIRRVAHFVRMNVPLWAVVVIAALCVGLRPELLLSRLRAVTTPALAVDEMTAKVVNHWAYLSGGFPAAFVRDFFHETTGSWHLLDVAPLGGVLPQVVCANWLVTACALGRRAVGYVARLAILALGLLALTGLQHLVTGFEHYRDMMLVVGLATTGIGFVFLIPRAGPLARVVLVGYALGVAAFDWRDVTAIAGHRYGVGEYAPASQATTDALRRYWRRDDARLRDATIGVIVHQPFPLEPLYQAASRGHGLELRFVDSVAFCRDPVGTISDLFAATCGRVAVAVAARTCPARWGPRLAWPPSRARDGTVLYLFDAPCLSTADRDWSAPEVLDLAQ